MAYELDISTLEWRQAVPSSYNLPSGTPLYENLSANAARITSSPVLVGGGRCVVEANDGYLVQVYGLDSELNYLGAGSFRFAAKKIAYDNPDAAFVALTLRTADGASSVQPADAAGALKSVTYPDVTAGGCLDE